jgi:hypothetical protein
MRKLTLHHPSQLECSGKHSSHLFLQNHDNDYPSDEEQVLSNIQTLKGDFFTAIKAFVRRDPLV